MVGQRYDTRPQEVFTRMIIVSLGLPHPIPSPHKTLDNIFIVKFGLCYLQAYVSLTSIARGRECPSSPEVQTIDRVFIMNLECRLYSD